MHLALFFLSNSLSKILTKRGSPHTICKCTEAREQWCGLEHHQCRQIQPGPYRDPSSLDSQKPSQRASRKELHRHTSISQRPAVTPTAWAQRPKPRSHLEKNCTSEQTIARGSLHTISKSGDTKSLLRQQQLGCTALSQRPSQTTAT